MRKTRYQFMVEIDRDDVPGWGNKPEDFQDHIQNVLNGTVGHYNPRVQWYGQRSQIQTANVDYNAIADMCVNEHPNDVRAVVMFRQFTNAKFGLKDSKEFIANARGRM